MKVWDAVASGTVTRGVDGVGSTKKCKKMEWCLFEAIKELDVQFLENSSTMCIHRDATNGLLLCRFQASDHSLDVRCGVFGVKKHFWQQGR